PTEIVLEQKGELERNLRRGGIVAAVVYGYVSLNGFLTWRLGVHDVRAFAIAHGVWGLAFLSSLVMVFRPSTVALLVTFACAIANCAFITTVYSPYLLVPTLITLHATLFAFVRDWTPRVFIITASCVAWTLSVFGDAWGLFPRTVRFTDGHMLIQSSVVS